MSIGHQSLPHNNRQRKQKFESDKIKKYVATINTKTNDTTKIKILKKAKKSVHIFQTVQKQKKTRIMHKFPVEQTECY